MKYYLDASFAVSAFAAESHTETALQWIADHTDDQIYISSWVLTEFSSALSMKIRMSQMSFEDRGTAIASWQQFVESKFLMLAVERRDFDSATEYVAHYKLGLPASDALHLAIAHNAGAALVTFDNRMAAAALELGVPVAAIG